MNRTKQTLLALCLALPFAAQAGPAENARPQARLNQPDASEQAKANLALVLEFFEGFFNRHDVSIAERLVAEDYRQHNPFVADGREPFVHYFSSEFAGLVYPTAMALLCGLLALWKMPETRHRDIGL